MPTHTEEDKARFRALVPLLDGVAVKPMFGSVGAFVNGNMFAGLFGTDLGVKLDEPGRAALQALPGSGPFGPAERPMGGWLALPEGLSDEEATAWFERAYAYVVTLPPKEPKPRRTKG
ncbi:TfoX/Sxy family protein [Raineyella sp. LH-20]|uniref:TfoX/Sxy family protein n=1 Tax=Raineyella sp. LH-20 TaxID=3081204 RepID=UPI002955D45A|nr:TfoX/Sxy family protein [Raineyella sp. LH-20]WOP20010.1 TfoX/Sxy family protein [Raineyella sp. LH-20]